MGLKLVELTLFINKQTEKNLVKRNVTKGFNWQKKNRCKSLEFATPRVKSLFVYHCGRFYQSVRPHLNDSHSMWQRRANKRPI